MLGSDRPRRESRPILALLSLGCLAIGIVGTLGAFAAEEPVIATRVVPEWNERTTLSYAPLRDDGSRLAPGAPGYLTQEAPRLALDATWVLEDPHPSVIDADATLTLVVQSPPADGRSGWSHREPLAEAQHHALAPVTMHGEADLRAIAAELEAARRPLDRAAWSIVVHVVYGTDDTSGHQGESTVTFPVSYTPPLYGLPAGPELEHVEVHGHEETVSVDASPTWPTLVARGLAPALLLLGAVASFRTRRAFAG